MKGEKGTCTIGAGETYVRATKFDTQKHAQDICNYYITMGFIHKDCIVYQCKVCGLWHFGKPEQAKLYSK